MKTVITKTQWEEIGKLAGWVKIAERNLSVPEKHQKAIALKTLKMSDIGARVMGGMTKEEARDFLKSIGYSDKLIRQVEASVAGEIKTDTPKTHSEIAKSKGLTRPCNANDLILVDEGLQCGNCGAVSSDHGKTWKRGL